MNDCVIAKRRGSVRRSFVLKEGPAYGVRLRTFCFLFYFLLLLFFYYGSLVLQRVAGWVPPPPLRGRGRAKDPFAVPSDSHEECCFGKVCCISHRRRYKFSVDKGHNDSVAVDVALVGVRSCRDSEGQNHTQGFDLGPHVHYAGCSGLPVIRCFPKSSYIGHGRVGLLPVPGRTICTAQWRCARLGTRCRSSAGGLFCPACLCRCGCDGKPPDGHFIFPRIKHQENP